MWGATSKDTHSQQVTAGNLASAYLALCINVDIYMPLSITLNFSEAWSQLAKSNIVFQPCIQIKENRKVCPMMKQGRESQKHKGYTCKKNLFMKTDNSFNQTLT